MPFSFTSDKLPGYRSFCKPETIHYKNIIEPLLRKIMFYFEHNTKDKVLFFPENLTLTLSMKTKKKYRRASKKWKPFLNVLLVVATGLQ